MSIIFLSQPVPVSIRCVNEECLFAGKMHAALFRAWKGGSKVSDWYDMVWFIRKNIPLSLGAVFQTYWNKRHFESR